jgi:quercetin dioxygenase-like cupin family protein
MRRMPSHRGLQRGAARSALSLALVLLSAAVTILATSTVRLVTAQEPPAIRFTTVASQNFTDQPRQYDLLQTLVELAPGAAVPSHRVAGKAIITVISGEVTRVEEGGARRTFKAGETFPEIDSDHFDTDVNLGSVPARFLATFLLPPGGEPLIFNPSEPPSAPGPKFVAVARTTVGVIPAQFTLAQGLFEVPPGWVGPLHTHDGWNMVTHLSGTVRNVVDGVVQPDVTFVHGPGSRHEAENRSGATVNAMFAAVGPTGAPPSRPLTSSGQAPITPPSTGDAGLAEPR